MSNDFGKQFADARDAQKISLEVAADATKIKLEYLESIEKGEYDFGMPEIYVRGFIEIYAKYLMLDVDAVMASCPIKEVGVPNLKNNKKSLYSTIVTNEKEQGDNTDPVIDDSVPFSKRLKEPMEKIKQLVRKKYFRAVSGGILIALVLLAIFSGTFGKHKQVKISASQVDKVLKLADQSTLSLIAAGNVKVVVKEKDSGVRIFSGSLEAGTVQKIPYSKAIQVFYDNGEFLLIKQANGEQLYPQPGRGGVEIK